MRAPGAGVPVGSPFVILAILGLLGLWVAAGMTGCGSSPGTTGAPMSTTSTAVGLTGTTYAGTVDATAGEGGTGMTAAPSTSDTNRSTTTVLTGSTAPGGGSRSLAYIGPMSVNTWQALRGAVINARDDGQKVLEGVAKLSVGPSADVGTTELDALSGIGFSAGANTTQPIAVATDARGGQVLVFAFTVTGRPESTTIVGFDRETRRVALVEGPLPVSDSTQNITTIPGQ